MQYRRFGRTEKALSVITLGGMRFPHGWDAPRSELPAATIDSCRDSVQRASYSNGPDYAEVVMTPHKLPVAPALAPQAGAGV